MQLHDPSKSTLGEVLENRRCTFGFPLRPTHVMPLAGIPTPFGNPWWARDTENSTLEAVIANNSIRANANALFFHRSLLIFASLLKEADA